MNTGVQIPFRAGATAYSSSCEVVHVDATNYHSLKRTTSENRVMSSCFTSFEDEVRPRGLGLKFAAEGKESYWLQGKHYSVSDGKYFLVNDSVDTLDVGIQNAMTWSVCVDVDVKLVNEVLLQMLNPDELDSYHNISRYLLTPDLFLREAVAGKQLQSLLNNLVYASASHKIERPAIEVIYELITLLVQENREAISSYYNLKTSRLSTRKELFRRLLLGKEVLDDSLFTDLSMKQVAEACCLSEFRFYRLFRQCFGDSPYNYLLRKRIGESVGLRKQGLSWSEIAYTLNFTDLAAFSKSFKKIKGVSPSKAVIS